MTKWIIAVVVVIIVIGAGLFWFNLTPFGGLAVPVEEEQANVDPMAGWGSYASTSMGVAIKYPPGYTLNAAFANTSVNPKKPIAGVSLTVPASMATGTNLSSDTYLSVEQLPRANNCTGDIFVAANVAAHDEVDGGIIYSLATSTGAAAGNRYEETVYAIKDSKPCTAVRYMVHYSVFENYPAGTVREFDRAALLAGFDAIRRTLQLTGSSTPTITP